MSQAEQFYDEHVAPVLLELARKCDEQGIPFLASVEYGEGDLGTTINKAAHASSAFYLPRLALFSSNIDSFMIRVSRDATKHGHSSMILTLLGVPVQPTTPEVPNA